MNYSYIISTSRGVYRAHTLRGNESNFRPHFSSSELQFRYISSCVTGKKLTFVESGFFLWNLIKIHLVAVLSFVCFLVILLMVYSESIFAVIMFLNTRTLLQLQSILFT